MSTKEIDQLIESSIIEDSLYGSDLGLYNYVNEVFMPPDLGIKKEQLVPAEKRVNQVRAQYGRVMAAARKPSSGITPIEYEDQAKLDTRTAVRTPGPRASEQTKQIHAQQKGAFEQLSDIMLQNKVSGEMEAATAAKRRAGGVDAQGNKTLVDQDGNPVFDKPEVVAARRTAATAHMHSPEAAALEREDALVGRTLAAEEGRPGSTARAKLEQGVATLSNEELAKAREAERSDTEKQAISRVATEQGLQLQRRKEDLKAFERSVGQRGLFGRIKGHFQVASEASKIAAEERQIGKVNAKDFNAFRSQRAAIAQKGAELLSQDIEWGKQRLAAAQGEAPKATGSADALAAVHRARPSAGSAPGPGTAEEPTTPSDLVDTNIKNNKLNTRGQLATVWSAQAKLRLAPEAMRLAKSLIDPVKRLGAAGASAPTAPSGHLR